jgi:hypothetical protein
MIGVQARNPIYASRWRPPDRSARLCRLKVNLKGHWAANQRPGDDRLPIRRAPGSTYGNQFMLESTRTSSVEANLLQ